MSYWGSHYSELPKENEKEAIKDDDPAKELCDNLNINKEQLDELKECFKVCNKSGKGTISPMELKSLLKSVGEDPDDEDIREILYEIDRDANGEIDFIEFIHFMHKTIKEPIPNENVEQSFKMIDYEDHGYLTIKELERMFLSFGQQPTTAELKDMVSFIDNEKEEGLITLESFSKYLVKEKLLRKVDEDDKEAKGPEMMRRNNITNSKR